MPYAHSIVREKAAGGGSLRKAIFVSYRRLDSSDVTGRIFDQMKARFGENRLFKDVDSIPLGKDFRTVISEAVGQCEVLLAVIGKDWLKITDDNGRRLIDDPNDYVHIEIGTALNRCIPVIPVLVENTAMPRASDLPEPLRDLAFRNGSPVRSDPDFHHDMDRLCSQLGEYVPEGGMRGPMPAQKRKYGWFGVWIFSGVAACVFLLFLMISSLPSTKNRQSDPSMAESGTVAPMRERGRSDPPARPEYSPIVSSAPRTVWPTPHPTSIPEIQPRPTEQPIRSQPSEQKNPVDIVRGYYDAINARLLHDAYELLSAGFQARKSFAEYQEVFLNTHAIAIRQIAETERNPFSATVAVSFLETDSDKRAWEWQGNVYVVREEDGWRIERTALRRH
ncbi:MAG TPA: toll/interleukin-1 receptor domain-containing protein [Chthoniobacterales bacterium]